jgi:hypothetical protein
MVNETKLIECTFLTEKLKKFCLSNMNLEKFKESASELIKLTVDQQKQIFTDLVHDSKSEGNNHIIYEFRNAVIAECVKHFDTNKTARGKKRTKIDAAIADILVIAECFDADAIQPECFDFIYVDGVKANDNFKLDTVLNRLEKLAENLASENNKLRTDLDKLNQINNKLENRVKKLEQSQESFTYVDKNDKQNRKRSRTNFILGDDDNDDVKKKRYQIRVNLNLFILNYSLMLIENRTKSKI